MTADPTYVLLADADQECVQWLRHCLGGRYRVAATASGDSALTALEQYPVDVVVVGRQLSDMSRGDLVSRMRARGRAADVSVFLADSTGDDGIDPSVYYVLDRGVCHADIQTVVASALTGPRRPPPVAREVWKDAMGARQMHSVAQASQRLALQRDIAGVSSVALEAVAELTGADRAYCLFYDEETGEMWSCTDEREIPAAAGLVGFAARTGTPVAVDSVRYDVRYRAAIDDPRGTGDENMLAQPIATSDGIVHAVLVAVCDEARGTFTAAERAALALYAELASPYLQSLALRAHADALLEQEASAPGEPIFRAEAMRAHAVAEHEGDVVRVSSSWIRWTYWALVAMLIGAGAYMSVGTIAQYSAGPAVVRVDGRTDVTAVEPGTIVSVDVVAGQRVSAGDVIARFHDAPETAELAGIRREFDAHLRNRMLDPSDQSSAAALRALRGRKDAAEARLAARVLRAPRDGLVGDVRVRPGQHLATGQLVVSITDDDPMLELVALLPGADRPMLRPGMTLRLHLAGYRDATTDLAVKSIADDVIGATEARRYLGHEIADSVPVFGSVVLVTARLPSSTFVADGQKYHFHDGMVGRAEVRVSSRSIARTLIPGLEGL